ncbi:MAG: biotin--[acetyl-CoA-carboxylase] ligase [SAR202 cluster bacterium]|nr:biotin--[acetyl-CoA-carboxylase] ligase [SAR202 cluster bacterium]
MSHSELDIDRLKSSLAGGLIGRRIVYEHTLGSTMDEARRLAEGVAEEGTVVIAEEQTKGRGRFDRTWHSPVGENLIFSVVLRPTQWQLNYVNMAATLAVAQTSTDATGTPASIKWPNDVRIGGRKVCGILIETSIVNADIKYAVVGIGFNVNFDISSIPEIANTATSLYRETGRRWDRTDVLGRLLGYMDGYYAFVRSGKSITSDWSSRMDTLGQDIRVKWGEQVMEGKAVEVDDTGNLVLERHDGSRFTVYAGEVTLRT